MKSQSIILSFLLIFISIISVKAQKYPAGNLKKENITVWGECGMCKKTIEKSALQAGASSAEWNQETKVLAVSYKTDKTDALKIQQAIAAAGYDTKDVSGNNDAYNNLHDCCKYERKTSSKLAKEKCSDQCKNEACAKETTNCKEHAACKGMACCKS